MKTLKNLVLAGITTTLLLTGCSKTENSDAYKKAVSIANNPAQLVTGKVVQSKIPMGLENYFLDKKEQGYMPLAEYNFIGQGGADWSYRTNDDRFTKVNPFITEKDGYEIGIATYLAGSDPLVLTVIKNPSREKITEMAKEASWITDPLFEHTFLTNKTIISNFKLWSPIDVADTGVISVINVLLDYQKRLNGELILTNYTGSQEAYFGLLEELKESYNRLLKEGRTYPDLVIDPRSINGLKASLENMSN